MLSHLDCIGAPTLVGWAAIGAGGAAAGAGFGAGAGAAALGAGEAALVDICLWLKKSRKIN